MPRTNLINLFELLTHLNTPDGIQASSGELYRGAIFGRDSLRVALDLLPWLPSIGERVIFSLVRYQGTGWNEITEEEPGKIHHEYRHQFVGGRKINSRQQQSLDYLSEKWGGNGKEVIYYGSIDATPQLIKLVVGYCDLKGRAILEERFQHRDGSERTVREALLAALAWLTKHLDESSLHLLEFENHNPRGLFWHVLRDGKLSYVHENGKLANRKAPIASLDVQGLAYDALSLSAKLLHDEYPDLAEEWQASATKLQESTLEQFWQEDRQVFAMAIDRDSARKPRQLKVSSSVMADLLESRLLIDLPEKERKRYVEAIVLELYSPEFLTPVGIRNRSLDYADLVPLWDYHGCFVSWVVITNIFALGLRNHGLVRLAKDMESRLLNASNQADSYLEFYYVNKDGRVFYTPQQLQKSEGQTLDAPGLEHVILGTNVPENIQAWTVSSLLRIVLNHNQPFYVLDTDGDWQEQLEREVSTGVSLLSKASDGENQIQVFTPLYVDIIEGRKAQERFIGLL